CTHLGLRHRVSVDRFGASLQARSLARDAGRDTFGTPTPGEVTRTAPTVGAMTTTTIEAATTRETGSAVTRIGAAAGPVVALCLFAGVAILGIPRGATDRELVTWWSDSGNQATAVVSMYLFVLAGLAFLVFLAKLRSRLLEAEGGAGELSSLA